LGRFMKGIVPLDELLVWYRSWNTKIRPARIRILGGEPLLHPDLESILYETRSHWQEAHIELITNGLLLPKMNPALFSALKEIEGHIALSKHFDDPHFNMMFEDGVQVLREQEIEPRLMQSHWFWMKCYHLNEQGGAVPYHSDPEKAWRICGVKNICTTLLDNCLYRCPQLGCYAHAVKKGFVPFEDWKVVLDYKPLTPSCSPGEIKAFMNGGACEQCCVCPEECQYADMYEKINVFGLPLTQKLYCGETHHE